LLPLAEGSDRASAAGQQIEDGNDDRDDQSDVNESTGEMQGQSGYPDQKEYHCDRPE
jgi:hypothetical protein